MSPLTCIFWIIAKIWSQWHSSWKWYLVNIPFLYYHNVSGDFGEMFTLNSLAKWLKPRSSSNWLPVAGPVSQITEGALDTIPSQWAFLPKLEVIWSSVPIKVPRHTSVALRTVTKLVKSLWLDEHNNWNHFRGVVISIESNFFNAYIFICLGFYFILISNSFYYIVMKKYLKLQMKKYYIWKWSSFKVKYRHYLTSTVRDYLILQKNRICSSRWRLHI